MKIAIVATFLGQKTSGAEISSFHLVRNLQQHGEKVFAVTAKITQSMPFPCYSFPLLRKVPNPFLLIGHRFLDCYMEKKMKGIFRRERPEVVHIQDPAMMIAALRAARKLHLPVMATVRDYRFACNLSIPLEQGIIPFNYSRQDYRKWLRESFLQAYGQGWLSFFLFPWFYNQNARLRRAFREMDFYLAVSNFVREQLIAAGIPGWKIRTVKVQKEPWQPLPLPTHKAYKGYKVYNRQSTESMTWGRARTGMQVGMQPDIPVGMRPDIQVEMQPGMRIFTAGGLKGTKGFDCLLRAFALVLKQYPAKHPPNFSRISHLPNSSSSPVKSPALFSSPSTAFSSGRRGTSYKLPPLSSSPSKSSSPKYLQPLPPVRLRLAGDGSARKPLMRLARKLQISHAVEFLGQISHESMKQEYAASDFVISPSLWPEPLSRIIFEAFSMGRPVVATNVGGSSELVLDGKTGLLVQPRDVTGMANAMLRMLSDAPLRERLALEASRLITSECGAERNYLAHREIYRRLCNLPAQIL